MSLKNSSNSIYVNIEKKLNINLDELINGNLLFEECVITFKSYSKLKNSFFY